MFVEVATAGSIDANTTVVTQPIPTALYIHYVSAVNVNGLAVNLNQTPIAST